MANLSEDSKKYLLGRQIHQVGPNSIQLETGFTLYLSDEEIEHINNHCE